MTKNDSELLNQPFALDQLVEWNEGSVVSRAIVKNEKGTLTVFAFSEGEYLSPHSAPFDAMVQILAGKAKVTIDENDFDLEEGQSIVMPANISHAVRALTNMKMLLVMIKG